jgi:hypothetical protein
MLRKAPTLKIARSSPRNSVPGIKKRKRKKKAFVNVNYKDMHMLPKKRNLLEKSCKHPREIVKHFTNS